MVLKSINLILLLDMVLQFSLVAQLADHDTKKHRNIKRKYQLGFIRAVSWSAQNHESHWSHVHVTLKYNTLIFMHFIRSAGYSAI